MIALKSSRASQRNGKSPAAKPKADARKPIEASSSADPSKPTSRTQLILVLAALVVVIGWAYWQVLAEVAAKWANDPQYSHGYLVPLFSLYLLWAGRSKQEQQESRGNWWGLLLLLAGLGMYLAGAYLFFDWFQAVSLLPVLAGSVLLIGGLAMLRRAAIPIAFLAFMFPLPFRIETALSQPLQRIATVVSTYFLQTIGMPAISEGNVIVINEARIGVVEACNGLGMMLLFFAIATGVALLVRRPLWQKIVLVVSAIPIAVIANVARIAVTGMLTGLVGQEWTDWIFHDLAGWFMMPLALALMGLELWFMSHLFVEVEGRTTRLQIGGGSGTPKLNQNGISSSSATSNSSVATEPVHSTGRTNVPAGVTNGNAGV
jgi:exosortase